VDAEVEKKGKVSRLCRVPLFGYADQLDHVGRSSLKTQRPPMVLPSTVTGSVRKVSKASLTKSNLTIPL